MTDAWTHGPSALASCLPRQEECEQPACGLLFAREAALALLASLPLRPPLSGTPTGTSLQ